MNKHTPGPWFVVDNGHYLEIKSDDHMWAIGIGDVCMSKHLDGGDNSTANARLIAAAPDLLAAVEMMMHGCRQGIEGRWNSIAFPSEAALNAALAAIAKARGES